eukprot:XP_764217.1 hypothetical protein [Theileria parva strain Muguga]
MNLFKVLLLVVSAFYTPFARCDFLQFMNDCTSYCKKAHSKFGNIKFFEANPTTTRHTAEDIGLTSVRSHSFILL